MEQDQNYDPNQPGVTPAGADPTPQQNIDPNAPSPEQVQSPDYGVTPGQPGPASVAPDVAQQQQSYGTPQYGPQTGGEQVSAPGGGIGDPFVPLDGPMTEQTSGPVNQAAEPAQAPDQGEVLGGFVDPLTTVADRILNDPENQDPIEYDRGQTAGLEGVLGVVVPTLALPFFRSRLGLGNATVANHDNEFTAPVRAAVLIAQRNIEALK